MQNGFRDIFQIWKFTEKLLNAAKIVALLRIKVMQLIIIRVEIMLSYNGFPE